MLKILSYYKVIILLTDGISLKPAAAKVPIGEVH